MPVHDWSRVDAGTFHAFHTAWIRHLSETLNAGMLPQGYYALPEQHAGRWITDVLTLQTPLPSPPPRPEGTGGIVVADAPPNVRRKLTVSASSRGTRRTLTIRHVSGHRIIALLEVVSSANRERVAHVEEFVDKIEGAILHDIHVLLVELFAPGQHNPQGMHGAVWARFDDEPYIVPTIEPMTLASYVAGPRPEAYVEHAAIGSTLPEMPLFLDPDRYINVPLEATYAAAFRGLPAFYREVLES